MPGFRARYTLWIDYVDSAGLGMNATNVVGQTFGAGQGQTLQFNQSICPGSGTFTAADVNSILAQVQTDLTTQLTAAIPRVANFTSGGG